MNTPRLFITLLIGCVCTLAPSQAPAARWSEAKANQWDAKQPWLVGSNYVPANAINELEMWQALRSIRKRSTSSSAGPKGSA